MSSVSSPEFVESYQSTILIYMLRRNLPQLKVMWQEEMEGIVVHLYHGRRNDARILWDQISGEMVSTINTLRKEGMREEAVTLNKILGLYSDVMVECFA